MTAETIQELRNRRGYSQSELAERAGISVRTIQRIEANKVRPYHDTLSRLAQALEVPVEEISPGDEKRNATDRKVILFHLSPLSGFFAPLAQLWAPFILWLLYRGEHRELDRHLREVLLFHAATTLLFAAGITLVFLSHAIGYAIAGLTVLFCTGVTLRNAYTLSSEGTFSYLAPFFRTH